MKRHAYLSAFLAFCSAFSLSCGAGDGSKVKPDDACAKRAEATCKARDMCSNGFSIQRDFGTKANCVAVEKQLCLESVTRPGSGVTADAADKCASALAKQTCADRATPLPECVTAVGQFKEGAACISSNQCASSYCDLAATAGCGKCAAKVGAGKTCDSSGDCVEGLFCHRALDAITMLQAEKGLCTAFLAASLPCNNDDKRCGEGLTCAGFSRSRQVDGICAAIAQNEGAVCNTTDKFCTTGLVCVGMPMMDGACKKPIATTGAACDRRNRMEPTCDGAVGLFCLHAVAEDPTGTCAKRTLAKPGADCGTLADGTSAVCDSGNICQRPEDPTSMPGMIIYAAQGKCVATARADQPCNTNGNIGPGCEPGSRCVLKVAGATAGTCLRRDFATVCGVKK